MCKVTARERSVWHIGNFLRPKGRLGFSTDILQRPKSTPVDPIVYIPWNMDMIDQRK